jgi:DNA-binding XRE family transcriptional regulator
VPVTPLPEQLVALVVDVLRERRAALEVSKKQLAVRAETSRTAIILMEAGKRLPSLELAIKLANGLDMPFSAVVTEAERRMAKELAREKRIKAS